MEVINQLYDAGNQWLDVLTARKHLGQDSCELANLFLLCRQQDSLQEHVQRLVTEGFEQYTDESTRDELDLSLLHRMGWNKIYQRVCFKALGDLVQTKVQEVCEGDFDEAVFPELETWLDEELLPYAKAVFGEEYIIYCDHIRAASVEIFIRLRADKIFDMIADFPDSSPALKELHVSIHTRDNIGLVGKQLRATLVRRLLHLGASTSQILDFYVSMIKALRVIDPSDALLNFVAVPVRSYLRNRKDTIRSIITSLTQSTDSDLHGELRQGGSLAYGEDEDDEDGGAGENWMPRKRNKELSDANVTSSRGLDILATLVSIYGSTELFIVEYRSLLSEKLLSSTKFSTDQEVANLELLKIRFGEESLHSCEIMIKDMEDSKRANNAVYSALSNKAAGIKVERDVDFIIVSDNYWPSLTLDGMQLHSSLDQKLKIYSDEYSVLKKPRKLNLLPQLGQVELTLDFEDGTSRDFCVTPLQANIIMFLSEAEAGMTVTDIYYKLEVDEDDVLQAVRYWAQKKVLRETLPSDGSDAVYSVIENQGDFESDDLDVSMEADNDAKNDALDSARQKAAQVMTENYIAGLLKSRGSMSLDKLFSLLQLVLQAASTDGGGSGGSASSKDLAFVSQASGLRQFLQSLSEQGKVDIVDGMYSLPSSH